MLSAVRNLEAVAVPSSVSPAAPAPYLRRARVVRAPSRRSLPMVVGLIVVTTLLFARVWQVTSAHSLSMDRDRLRKEVHGLENRIRLSSELAMQEALHEGLNYAALAKQGFESPSPDVLVDVDLARPFPRVVPRQGAMARLSADVGRFVRGILPAPRVAPATSATLPASGLMSSLMLVLLIMSPSRLSSPDPLAGAPDGDRVLGGFVKTRAQPAQGR